MTSAKPSCCHQFGSDLNPSELFWQMVPDSDKWQHNWTKFKISKPIHTFYKLIVQDTNVPQKKNEAGREIAIDSAILDKLKHLWNCYWFSSAKQLAALGSFVQLPVLISATLSLCRSCSLVPWHWVSDRYAADHCCNIIFHTPTSVVFWRMLLCWVGVNWFRVIWLDYIIIVTLHGKNILCYFSLVKAFQAL